MRDSTQNIFQYLDPQELSDHKILETTDICRVYEHIFTLRKVLQISEATAEVFF